VAYWIEDIKNDLGVTVIMIEHDMPLVSAVSDRVLASTTAAPRHSATAPQEVQSNPAVIEAYLGRRAEMSEPLLSVRNLRLLRADHGDPG
jgi:branched-chain amino acid transport system ATP-binding protein